METSARAAGAIRRPTWATAALLASLAMMGPFSVDMYLPAFGAMGAELGVGSVAPLLALSLTTLALGMAVFLVASFVLWLTYQRRARVMLKGWTP